jgi:hypothetical protein
MLYHRVCSAIGHVTASGRTRDLDQPHFFRVAMHFLCATRSDEEHVRIRRRLLGCDCHLQDAVVLGLHQGIKLSVGVMDALNLTLSTLCSHISGGLELLTPGKFRKSKRNAPNSVDDNGASPGEVLDAILRWTVNPGYRCAAFVVIRDLVRFWDLFTVEVLNRPSSFLLAMQHLRYAIDVFPAPALAANKLDRLVRPRQFLEQGGRMARPEFSPIPFTLTGDLVLDGRAEPLGESEEIFVRAFAFIWEVRNRDQRMYVGCTTMLKRTAVCARCGVVRYCSREVWCLS